MPVSVVVGRIFMHASCALVIESCFDHERSLSALVFFMQGALNQTIGDCDNLPISHKFDGF